MKIRYQLIISAFLIIFLTSCGENNKQSGNAPDSLQEFSYSEEIGKLISYTVPSVIMPDNEITVMFSQNIAERKTENISNEVFSFTPQIDGTAHWKDLKTVIFKPNKPLKPGQSFTGSLNLTKLLPNRELKEKEFKFSFRTVALEISDMELDFESINNSENSLTAKAEVLFTLPVLEEDLKKSVNVDLNGEKLYPYIKKLDDKGKNYEIKTGLINRREKHGKELNFTIENKKLDIVSSVSKTIIIPDLRNLSIVNTRITDTESNKNIRFDFSHELDKSMNLNGFIVVDPDINFTAAVRGNQLIINGGFQAGENYDIVIRSGIKGKLGEKLKIGYKKSFKFDHMQPQVKFLSEGIILPSANKKKIKFKSVNIKKVTCRIYRIYENNITEFMHDTDFDDYYWYSYSRVGETVYNSDLELTEQTDRWIISELDLQKIFKDKDYGIYNIKLEFNRNDITAGRNYNRRAEKYVLLSDLSIIAKKTSDKYHVHIVNVIDNRTENGVKVQLISYNNQILDETYTNYKGKAVFNLKESENDSENNNSGIVGNKPYYITAEKNGMRSILFFQNAELDKTLFETGGEILKENDINAFIYTERGVYRPGDSVFVSAIIRNHENTFPDNHPVQLKVFDPSGTLIYELNSTKGQDGFYVFDFKTAQNHPTGDWRLELHAGSKKFSQRLRIETVVPYKLKVNITTLKNEYEISDELSGVIESKYLFGTPAKNHKIKYRFSLLSDKIYFPSLPSFNFDNPAQSFNAEKSSEFSDEFNEKGQKEISWDIPEIKKLPGKAKIVIDARVFEKSGRPVLKSKSVPVNLHNNYVGLNVKDDARFKYGEKIHFKAVYTDKYGNLLPGRKIKYTIYKSYRYWWWDYSSREDYKKHFKENYNYDIVQEGSVISDITPVDIEFEPNNSYGSYFIEIQDGDDGHSAGAFFRIRWWGGSNMKNADMLSIDTDKEEYYTGEKASIIFEAPKNSRALISVEKSDEILFEKWMDIENEENVFELPVTVEMTPNVYVFVQVMQPHSQTENDRPIRLFGIVPVNVVDRKTVQKIILKTPEKIKPKEEFEIEIQTADRKQTQFTAAVVDEGLLDLTDFQTPNPWKHFFKKIMLLVKTYDIFGDIIGAEWETADKVFTVGGGMSQYRKRETGKEVKRFKPVVMFKGPVQTDENGYKKIKFKMHDYIGSVRIMIIAANSNRYGNADAAVPVKSELMISPEMPRFLRTGDKIRVPAVVFAMEDSIGQVKVFAESEGSVEIIGKKEYTLNFAEEGSEDVFFEMKAKKEIGPAKIHYTAKSSQYEMKTAIDIQVKSDNPYITKEEYKVIKRNEPAEFMIPNTGLNGTMNAWLEVSPVKRIDLGTRLNWLIRYPYGCIEQTVSSVFPQLYLDEVMDLSNKEKTQIDKYVNSGIDRLRRFITPEGGLSYWPGRRETSVWGTNYAGYFLIEAKEKGYYVPEDLYSAVINFQKTESRNKLKDYDMYQSYRLFLLAAAGEPDKSAMNYMKIQNLEQMDNTEKFLLAGAYYLIGMNDTAEEIISSAEAQVEVYSEFAETYGSDKRDYGIMLQIYALMNKTEEAFKLYDRIAGYLNSSSWYSTQTTSYMLLGAGKFLKHLKSSQSAQKELSFEISFSNGKKLIFETKKPIYRVPLNDYLGVSFRVDLNSPDIGNAVLYWEGIPVDYSPERVEKNLSVKVDWYDADGNRKEIDKLKRGESVWGVAEITKTFKSKLEETALVVSIPSGWEFENTRLTGEKKPGWLNERLFEEEYLDIRDDKIMWFFDLPYTSNYSFERGRNKFYFLFKINAVTEGSFSIPAVKTEAMYDSDYISIEPMPKVEVIPNK